MEALLRELWQLREIQELAQLMESGGGPALVTGLSPVHRAMTAAADEVSLRRRDGEGKMWWRSKKIPPHILSFLCAGEEGILRGFRDSHNTLYITI